MKRLRNFFSKQRVNKSKDEDVAAKRAVLEEIFNDVYQQRRRIYRVNFIRGIMFGAGSALGGTVVIALIVWLLSLFVNMPLIGDIFKSAQESIEHTTQQASDKVVD